MRVKNRKCIRRLSFKSLWASRKRNIIAICAIALTTLMFTSLFTIMLSVNSSYEIYNFRQAGGYSDGIFKDYIKYAKKMAYQKYQLMDCAIYVQQFFWSKMYLWKKSVIS